MVRAACLVPVAGLLSALAVAGCSVFHGRESATSTGQMTSPTAATTAQAPANAVFFTPGKTELTPDARRQIQRWAQTLRARPNTRFTIIGHGDEHGTRDYAIALGAERAQAVKDYLVSLGVDEGRLATTSYGKESPAVVGPAAEVAAFDSRADIVSESIAAVPQPR